jgi:multisubunit Na+/H+ antiporter MnhG subunit
MNGRMLGMTHGGTLGVMLVLVGVGSAVLSVVGVMMVPWVVVRLPADYFVRLPTKHGAHVRAARAVAGIGLVLLGVALLFLPGQGVLTILLGLALLSDPRRVGLRLLARPALRRTVETLRTRRGVPPLELP